MSFVNWDDGGEVAWEFVVRRMKGEYSLAWYFIAVCGCIWIKIMYSCVAKPKGVPVMAHL